MMEQTRHRLWVLAGLVAVMLAFIILCVVLWYAGQIGRIIMGLMNR